MISFNSAALQRCTEYYRNGTRWVPASAICCQRNISVSFLQPRPAFFTFQSSSFTFSFSLSPRDLLCLRSAVSPKSIQENATQLDLVTTRYGKTTDLTCCHQPCSHWRRRQIHPSRGLHRIKSKPAEGRMPAPSKTRSLESAIGANRMTMPPSPFPSRPALLGHILN